MDEKFSLQSFRWSLWASVGETWFLHSLKSTVVGKVILSMFQYILKFQSHVTQYSICNQQVRNRLYRCLYEPNLAWETLWQPVYLMSCRAGHDCKARTRASAPETVTLFDSRLPERNIHACCVTRVSEWVESKWVSERMQFELNLHEWLTAVKTKPKQNGKNGIFIQN